MTTSYDCSHPAMHRLAAWPVFAKLADGRTRAERLYIRAVASIYAGAGDLALQAWMMLSGRVAPPQLLPTHQGNQRWA